MSRTRLSAIKAPLGVAFLGLLLTACGVSQPSSTVPTFVTSFAGPDGPVGLTLSNGTLALYVPNGTGGFAEVTHVTDQPRSATVHVAAFGGNTGARLNSFVFGDAPTGATSVEVSPEGVVGRVTNGLFVVGLAQKDLNPLLLHWTFLGADGSVLMSGDGVKE